MKYSDVADEDKVANTSTTRLEYLKHIAHTISLRTDTGKNILGSSFDTLTVRYDTVLADFLEGAIRGDQRELPKNIIYPFGVNRSQKQATENALMHKLSIIQGPPGTGKTQTILNIIANVVSEGKTVAVVSNNNSATDNIHEKLQEYRLDFIAARLGSMQNKQNFIAHQAPPEQELLDEWKLSQTQEEKLQKRVTTLTETIHTVLQRKNKMQELRAQLHDVEVEAQHFATYYTTGHEQVQRPTFWRPVRADNLLSLWQFIEQNTSVTRRHVFARWLVSFRFGVRIDHFFQQETSDMVTALQKLFYDQRMRELKREIRLLKAYVRLHNLDKRIAEQQRLSLRLFQSVMARKYSKRKSRPPYSLRDLWARSKELSEDYPVVLSTTHSLRGSLSPQFAYDYVIVDEASQVDLATFALAMSCAKNAVVVGDTQQLPNVITDETRRQDAKLVRQFSITEPYQFSRHSALTACRAVFGEAAPVQPLREHYRCHPQIIGFCNKMFYDNQLIVLTTDEDEAHSPLKVYTTAKGNHARDNRVNQRQIEVTLQEVVQHEKLDLNSGKVGMVSPYRNHAKALNDALSGTKTMAATVDKFQGREKETIIINTVDNRISDFVSDPQRLNVAVSRAQKQLVVVTNGNENSFATSVDELVAYIRHQSGEVRESSVHSIFDVLYSTYYKKKMLKTPPRIIKKQPAFYSEKLMYDMICRVLQERKWRNLDCVGEYPLRMLVDAAGLEGRAREYVQNGARVDFLILTKTAKQPVLAIEVDGYAFHQDTANDALKNQILEQHAIPLVRFSTTGSNEQQQLVRILQEILQER